MNDILIAVGILLAILTTVFGVVGLCMFILEMRRSSTTVSSIVRQLTELENHLRQFVGDVNNTSQIDQFQKREIRQMLKISETRILDAIVRVTDSIHTLLSLLQAIERRDGSQIHVNNSSKADQSCKHTRTDFYGDTHGGANVNAGDGQQSAGDFTNDERGKNV